jgi:hypothetical protein
MNINFQELTEEKLINLFNSDYFKFTSFWEERTKNHYFLIMVKKSFG